MINIEKAGVILWVLLAFLSRANYATVLCVTDKRDLEHSAGRLVYMYFLAETRKDDSSIHIFARCFIKLLQLIDKNLRH